MAVLGDTGSLFKDLTAVAALERKDLVNAALADIGIALPTQTGVHEHLMNITQSRGLAVDIVFTVTAAVVSAGDHDLVGIIAQCPVRIIQGQSRFRKAHSRALLGTTEDHVLHLGAAEGLAALLAHDPKDRIGNIRFTGTVGADNGGDVIAKADQRLIRKGLKSLHFQTF